MKIKYYFIILLLIIFALGFIIGFFTGHGYVMAKLDNILSEYGYKEMSDGWYSKQTGMICTRVDGVTENRSYEILQHEWCHHFVEMDYEHFCGGG